MRKTQMIASTGAALALAGLTLAGAFTSSAAGAATAQPAKATYKQVHACAQNPVKGHASCFAIANVPTSSAGVKAAAAGPTGLGPSDIRAAYNLAGTSAGGRTVAIVDAGGYANAQSDLATFRSQYGLSSCTSGCFTKLDQNGGTSYPAEDSGWAEETALDLDAVSSACPDCKILLVEADDASFANLGKAVQTAAAQPGVAAISNSYGGGDASDGTYGKYYNFPGIAVTASAGDSGWQGASYPASSSSVVAVGGTTLSQDSSSRGWNESVWDGTGSGCSNLNSALPAAASAGTGCSGRAMNDLAADADPATGLGIYDSDAGGWVQVGGTSLSSPLIAGMYALSGNTADANSLPYQNASQYNDITSGSNGSCSPSQICQSGSGWDGPTGVGSPNGVGGL
jgi:subtilase family serine protease